MAPDEFKAMFELWPSFGWPEGNDPEYHIPYLWEVCFRVLQTKNLEVFKWLKEQMSSDVYAFIIKNNKFELLDNMMRQKQYNVCNFLLTDQDCFEFVLQDRWYNHEVLEHFYTEQTKLLPVRSTAAIIPGVEIAPGYRAQTLADHIGEDKPRVSAAPSGFFSSPVIDKTIQKTPDQEDVTGKYQIII